MLGHGGSIGSTVRFAGATALGDAARLGGGDGAQQQPFQVGDRVRCHRTHRSDAIDEIAVQLFVQQLQNLGRDRRIEMREHQRDDLRMLVLDQIGDRARIHPLERFEPRALLLRGDPREHVFGAVMAQRLFHDVLDLRTRAEAQRGALAGTEHELVEHLVDLNL